MTAHGHRQRCVVMLTLPVGQDRERVIRAARRWFELCAARFHGEFGAAVRAAAPHRLERVGGRPGAISAQVGTAVFPDDGYAGEPWEWDAPYSPSAWDELLHKIGELPSNASFEANTLDELGRRGGPRLSVAMSAEGGYLGLTSSIDEKLANDPAGQQEILATVREVAEDADPVAAAVSEDEYLNSTPLERALNRFGTIGFLEAGSVLRNYGWLTVLGERMGERLGGLDRLRASGAFVEARQLTHGGYWLLATRTWDEYGPEEANRLFEIFAPVLPPGRPRLSSLKTVVMGEPPRLVTLPNVVAERDPTEITGLSGSASC
jgi:hypothetical protein